MEKYIFKMSGLAEMIKVTCLFRDNTINTFTTDWKSFIDFC